MEQEAEIWFRDFFFLISGNREGGFGRIKERKKNFDSIKGMEKEVLIWFREGKRKFVVRFREREVHFEEEKGRFWVHLEKKKKVRFEIDL